MMKLSKMFPGAPDVEIKGLCIDSRKAKEGDLFFCLKGLEADGHKYAAKAVELGAVAVVHSDELEKAYGVTYVKVEDTNRALNEAASVFNEDPGHKMTVFGVTGTNGKTTTTSIISDVFSHKKPCGYMGTIAVRYGNYSRVPNLTTPDALEVHSNLKEMYDHDMEAVAMEVSSHGLAMGRVDTVDFDVAIFTNLTYDHLDYHKTMENYLEAKAALFKNMKKDGLAVLNADDDVSIEKLKEVCNCRYVTYGIKNDADYRAENLKLSVDSTEFDLVHDGKSYRVKTNLSAEYNIYNLLGAIAGMHFAGMAIEEMIPYLEHIAQVDGRMEIIDEGQDFAAIVDYAHTPDGFEQIFKYAEEVTEGKIYCVFGCAGKRDKVKRKVLGEIAGKHCETVYVTEEDPRDETVEGIAEMIMEGIPEAKRMLITDRYEAIKTALENAEKGDTVLILGKGDEPYMYRKNGREPWMGDHEAARKVLKEIKQGI